MTKEEKELLLKDLCGRLPYGVQIHIDFNENRHIVGDATLNTITSITGQFFNFTDFEQDFKNGDCCPISGFGSHKVLHLEDFKPYLRPMSSMTESEKEELKQYLDAKELDCSGFGYIEGGTLENYVSNVPYSICSYVIDWFNAHHFDYRGLIPMGLALEAPEEMYRNG